MGFGQFSGAFALALILAAVPASAEIADFYGVWSNAESDASGIARVVVTPGTGTEVNIHLFGRCRPADCDWGTERARAYADDPASSEVRSLAADFDAGGVHRRIVLHIAVGHALRFEVQTDFANRSAGNNFATGGAVAYAGDWSSGPRVAAAPPSPTAAPAVGAPAEMPAAPAPQPAPSSSWFGGTSFIGVGPAVPAGYVPAAGEDCRPFDPAQIRVGYVEEQWQLGDFSHRLLRFASHQSAARLALTMLAYYHFDEQCFVGHDSTSMIYWKRAGQVPKPDMPGQDCVAFDPAIAKAEQSGDGWRVAAGGNTLLQYDDKDDAGRALSVIQTYRLNRQCFFARPNSKAQYWLSQ